ncbi:unnamed protein product, partial [Ectocarpus sp. 6 AP-2014]
RKTLRGTQGEDRCEKVTEFAQDARHLNGCIASQLRNDLKGKVSYIRINGEGPVEPVADMETLERMARLLQTDSGRKLFQQN